MDNLIKSTTRKQNIGNNPKGLSLSIEEIMEDIPKLKHQWALVKDRCRYQSFVTEHLDKLIQQCKIKKFSEIDIIIIIRIYNEVRLMIEQAEKLSFKFIMLIAGKGSQIKTFLRYSNNFDDKTYWQEFREAYTYQFDVPISYAFLKSMFTHNRKHREFIMTENEREFLKKLPDKITVYRGCSSNEVKTGNFGISWTLSKKIAEQFRTNKEVNLRKGILVERIIPKSEVIAYFDEPDKEIIYFPK